MIILSLINSNCEQLDIEQMSNDLDAFEIRINGSDKDASIFVTRRQLLEFINAFTKIHD